MKRKNEFLYEFIYEQLANGVKRTFVQIDEIAKQRLGDLYNQKQLRNLLYNLVSTVLPPLPMRSSRKR